MHDTAPLPPARAAIVTDGRSVQIERWKSQLLKGAAELAVLAVVERDERYGLELLEAVRAGGLDLAEGTIYPLLNRLQKEGKLASRWAQAEGASRARKYYRLTPEGGALLSAMRAAWLDYAREMMRLVATEDVRAGIMPDSADHDPVRSRRRSRSGSRDRTQAGPPAQSRTRWADGV